MRVVFSNVHGEQRYHLVADALEGVSPVTVMSFIDLVHVRHVHQAGVLGRRVMVI